ncbi:MAG: radical SAM protein [Candidatus Aenigmarchaeota archaeon]|nr:radical SAM protein [Candidatus Aenigmarchaeota archaeon]
MTSPEYPIFVWWQITHRCNLKCEHCFAYEIKDELSTDEARNIIDQLSESNIMLLKITGGEPLVREDIFDILKYACDKKITTILSTNATLITNDVAKKLSQTGIDTVQVSLDSSDKLLHEKVRGIGTFDKTIRGIKNLLDEKLNVAIVTTLMSHNIDSISETLDFAYKLGIRKFSTRRLVMYGRARENWMHLSPSPQKLFHAYNILRNKSKEYPDMTIKPECTYMFGLDPLLLKKEFAPVCECGKTQCGIKPDGTVTPCEYVTIPAGNLKKDKFIEIWRNAEIFKKFRNLDVSQLKGKCSRCSHKEICKGGCRASALAEYGDFYASDPFCWRSS